MFSSDSAEGEFDDAFARLQARIEHACTREATADWPARMVAGIRAALAFAAADPLAANRLTHATLKGRPRDQVRHERLMSYLVGLLRPGRELLADDPLLVSSMERTVAARVLMLVYQRLQQDRTEELPVADAREAIEYALTPYVGVAEATRLARRQ